MNQQTYGWICIFMGSFFLAIGGFLITKGWDLFGVHTRKRNLINAVVQECIYNGCRFEKEPLSGVAFFENPLRLKLYPTLRKSALSAAQSSGLYSYKNSKEAELLLALVNYEDAISLANEMFQMVNKDITRVLSDDIKKSVAQKQNKDVLSSEWYKMLLEHHKEIRSFLCKEYKWAWHENKPDSQVE